MAEVVLAAAGASAALLQLAEYSKRFLTFLREYQAKSKNLPLSFQTILSQQHLLLRSLELLEARAQHNLIDDDLVPHVQSLSDACHKEIEYLKGILTKIAVSGTSSRAMKAIKAIRHEKDIQRSAATLKDCFETLSTFYQVTAIALPQAPSIVETVDSNYTGSFITADEPVRPVQEVQTALVFSGREEQHVLQQTTLFVSRCNCRRREIVESLQRRSLGSCTVSSETLSSHRSGCPLYPRSVKHHKVAFNLRYTMVMLRVIAGITVSMTYGAGGLSLSPNLTLKGVRREDSPAFRLFDDEEWHGCVTGANRVAKINQVSLQLRQIFDRGAASPFDLDPEGNSLVWAAYWVMFFYSPLQYSDLIETELGLLEFLSSVGVPFDNVPRSYRAKSPFTKYLAEVGNEFNADIVAFMIGRKINYHLPFHRRLDDGIKSLQILLCEGNFPDYAEYLNCNALQMAIFQREVSQVEKIARANPSAVQFQNHLGQSPLHAAADWPLVIALLLRSGANPYQVDYSGNATIDYACLQRNCEVVSILLEAGSPLPRRELMTTMTSHRGESYQQEFKLVVSHLASRRRELLRIAQILLPVDTLNSIVLPNETIPDSSSFRLVEAVCAAGNDTQPEYWFMSRTGLYQTLDISPAAADILYEAGFTYLEGRDAMGETPLTCAQSSAMIGWLYRKGVSFTERTTQLNDYDTSSTVSVPSMYWPILKLAPRIPKPQIYRGSRPLHMLSRDDIEALNIVLQDDFSRHRDSCCCLCCSGGCSPEVIICKTMVTCIKADKFFYWPPMNILRKFIQLIDDTDAELDGRLALPSLHRLSLAAIRMALFLDLGLRHLCCKVDSCGGGISPPVSQQEADEIREEDRFLTERFNILLPKAQSEWKRSAQSLAEFWQEFHRAHICGQRDEPLDQAEVDRMRELGVDVHERGDEADDCQSLYGDEKVFEVNDA
ncbi:MAG: hypothetical protein Q9170_007002, partial [Blastenia crenularia]